MGCAVSASSLFIIVKYIRRRAGFYSCSGTADCVKLAKSVILDRDPDLVVSGINHGDNSGVNVHYPVSGCCEGRLYQWNPFLAFSLSNHDQDADFPRQKSIQQLVELALAEGLPAWTCLNVNFPGESGYKGVKVCEQATAMDK